MSDRRTELYRRLDRRTNADKRLEQTPERLARIAVNSAAVDGVKMDYDRLLERFKQLLAEEKARDDARRDAALEELVQLGRELGLPDELPPDVPKSDYLSAVKTARERFAHLPKILIEIEDGRLI